jgi:Plavaka transposase
MAAKKTRISEVLPPTLPCVFGDGVLATELYMVKPKLVKCPDGHFHHAIFSLGPYIADYNEQVWLPGIVSNWCPKYVLSLTWMYIISYLTLDVMLIQKILTVQEVAPDFMKWIISSYQPSIQASFGTNMELDMISWSVLLVLMICPMITHLVIVLSPLHMDSKEQTYTSSLHPICFISS